MIDSAKTWLKGFLPVEADAPGDENDYIIAQKFITLSLKRSGQHAVINWLCGQAQNIIHFNHCYFERRGMGYWITASTNRIVKYETGEKYDSGVQSRERLNEYLSGIKSYKRLLHSLEDTNIEHRQLIRYVKRRNPIVVLIVRDPYNWLASTMKRRDCSYEKLKYKKQMLIKYLEQALSIKDYLNHAVVVINYNKWATDIEYRKNLCDSINIPFSSSADSSLLEVPDFGGGSSFSGVNPVSKNSVFNRWEEFASEPDYLSILNDSYLIELSRAFFGTDCPLNDCSG